MNKEAFIRLKQAIEDYFVQLHPTDVKMMWIRLGKLVRANLNQLIYWSDSETLKIPNLQWLTLSLHSSPDQGQWVAGQLATCAGGGATSQEHKHSRISAVCGEALQPGILQSLTEESRAKRSDWTKKQ